MHQIVLPGMVGRKRGLILNISSTTSLQPMFAIYGATKAFVNYFSEALSYEYERKGVTIQVISDKPKSLIVFNPRRSIY